MGLVRRNPAKTSFCLGFRPGESVHPAHPASNDPKGVNIADVGTLGTNEPKVSRINPFGAEPWKKLVTSTSGTADEMEWGLLQSRQCECIHHRR